VLLPPSEELQTIIYDGSKGVRAVFVNDNDQAFLENYMDPQSLQFFMQNIAKIDDTVTRSLIWFNISQLNKQTLLRLNTYVPFVQSNLLD
jgi:aminopeptidase N